MNLDLDYQQVGLELAKLRKRSDLTQSTVAVALQYKSPQFISNIERGLCPIPPHVLKALFNMYNLSLKERNQLLNTITKEFKAALDHNTN